jgi:hypothetical protein
MMFPLVARNHVSPPLYFTDDKPLGAHCPDKVHKGSSGIAVSAKEEVGGEITFFRPGMKRYVRFGEGGGGGNTDGAETVNAEFDQGCFGYLHGFQQGGANGFRVIEKFLRSEPSVDDIVGPKSLHDVILFMTLVMA